MTSTSKTQDQDKRAAGDAPAQRQWPPIAAGLTLLVGAFLFSLGNCGLLRSGDAAPTRTGAGPSDAPVPVRVAQIKTDTLQKTITRTGEVRAAKHAVLKSRAAGTVASVQVDLGDSVQSGQLLVRIDPGVLGAELREQEAAMVVLNSRLQKANLLALHHISEFERRSRLHAEAALSASELAQAKITADTAQADAKLIEAEIERAKAQLDAIRLRIADTEVRAPFAGKIAERTVDPGTTVSNGDVLLSLVSTGGERVAFSVAESDVHLVRVGQDARVAAAGRTHHAKVERIGATLQPENRSLLVLAILTGETEKTLADKAASDAPAQVKATETPAAAIIAEAGSAPALLPGMFVEVTLQTQSPPEAVIVPVAALFGKGLEQSVFWVDAENRAHSAAVKLVFQEGEYAAVIGLNAERPVVIAGLDKLKDGQSVEAIP